MLDLLDALDKMPSHSSTTKSYLGRAWAWAMFWLLGDVLATSSSFRGRNRAWSAINSKLPHLELHHRAFRWFVPVPQALDPQLDAGDLQRSAVHSSNGAVSGRLHQFSVAPLFKASHFVIGQSPKELMCLDVLVGWSWELSLATHSMGAYENKNPLLERWICRHGPG